MCYNYTIIVCVIKSFYHYWQVFQCRDKSIYKLDTFFFNLCLKINKKKCIVSGLYDRSPYEKLSGLCYQNEIGLLYMYIVNISFWTSLIHTNIVLCWLSFKEQTYNTMDDLFRSTNQKKLFPIHVSDADDIV